MPEITIYDDKELIASLKNGEEWAFTHIYEKYWKILLAISYKSIYDQVLAEGIVQEVFVSLWNRRNELEIERLEAYLATAVKFSTFKTIQRNKRHAEIEVSLKPEQDYYSEDENIEALFLKEYVSGIIEHLPAKCKLVFQLSRDQYLSNEEISQSLGITVKAVEAHITRAIKILRINLRKVGLEIIVFLALFLY